MNSAFNHNHAGMRAGRLVRQAARAALACALVLGSGVTLAQQRERDFGGPPPPPHSERFRLPQADRDPRGGQPGQPDMRAYEDARRAQQAYPQQYQQPYSQQPDPARRSGRMTADERREMRRQVNEAKDYYPQHR